MENTIFKRRNIWVVKFLTAVCPTSSLILMLGPLVEAGCSSGHFVCCFCVFPPASLFFLPSLFCFILATGNPDSPVFFTSLAVFVFFSAAGLGFFGPSGSMDSFGSDLLAVLLKGFGSFDAGSLVALRVLVFGSDGLHSSLSSSLLAVWEKDLIGEKRMRLEWSSKIMHMLIQNAHPESIKWKWLMSLTGRSPYHCSLQVWQFLLGVWASSDERDAELVFTGFTAWTTALTFSKITG